MVFASRIKSCTVRWFLVLAGASLASLSVKGQASPFAPGEKITYIIRYGPVHAGLATLELTNDTLNGRKVLRSYFFAKTVGVADAVIRIRDVYESYMDPVTGLPFKSVRNIQEARYRKYNVVLFDHNSRADSAVLTSDLTGKHVAQKGILDILSCFYQFRKKYLANNYPFKKGEVITIMTWFTDELYPIKLQFAGMDEVKTRVGKIKCYKFNPATEVGRLFKTQEDVSIWFSADKNCLPVQIRFDIFVGAFTVDLLDYEGLKDELEIKTK
jgi:hypothetical protein